MFVIKEDIGVNHASEGTITLLRLSMAQVAGYNLHGSTQTCVSTTYSV